ncbi:hypothetical protein SMICM304S_10440 [Streptomyces microflavus]
MPVGPGTSVRVRTASANSASPARTAGPVPYAFHTVGRRRRVSSPSMMSSWMREKVWISSTATAPVTPSRPLPPAASAPSTASAWRTPLPCEPGTGSP